MSGSQLQQAKLVSYELLVPTYVAQVKNVTYQGLSQTSVQQSKHLTSDALSQADVRVSKFVTYFALQPLFGSGPIPVFPTLPQGYPIKVAVNLDTTIVPSKSLRESRYAQQTYPTWDIEIPFEELLDQTQNETPYLPFSGYTQYQALVQLFLMMYGQGGTFALDCPWDDSRSNQQIGTGDGQTVTFTIYRTWGSGANATLAPIGMINAVFNVTIGGSVAPPNRYTLGRNTITFPLPPAAGAAIVMSFSFYYLCRFVEDEQTFEEFSKNRWTVPSLKMQTVNW